MSKEEIQESVKCRDDAKIYESGMSFRNRGEDQMAASYTEIAFQSQCELNSRNNISDVDLSDECPNIHHQSNDNRTDASGRDNYFKEATDGGHPKRPESLMCDIAFPYNLDGTVRREGDMTHFVAENLEYKLKLSSPITKRDISPVNVLSKNSTPSTSAGLLPRHFLQPQLAPIDSNVLSDIEIDAQYLAASVDNLTENLYNLLRSISSIAADNVEIHKNSVNKLTDNMDANIKCMYTIMAKTEEISKSMKPTEQLALRIREIKRLVDMLENNI